MADEIAQEALQALRSVVASYLPPVVPPLVTRELLVIAKAIKPLGIGGYVGPHLPVNSEIPDGDLLGRAVVAQAEITFTAGANNLANINTAIDQSTTALLTNDRATLRGDGIYRLELQQLTPPSGSDAISRSAVFDIRFEFVRPPSQSQGIIETVRLNTLLSGFDGRAQFIANIDFSDLAALPIPLLDFASVTDPDIDVGSETAGWTFNPVTKRIEQRNAVRGGVLTAAQAQKAGAQLLVQPGQRPLAIRNGVFSTEFESSSPDGVGMVFRWIDADNFYFFLASARHGYQMFGKKVAGNFAFLLQGGLRQDLGFEINTRQQLRVVANGSSFEAWFGESRTLSGEDSSLPAKGQVGLLTHGNDAAFFYGVDVASIP